MNKKRLKSFSPLNENGARTLILGSMPGKMSLARREYYGNPQNDFWRILSAVFGGPMPEDYAAKKAFLGKHKIALWDVFKSCERVGSLDAAIKDSVVNDIGRFLKRNPRVTKILLNGKKTEEQFLRNFRNRGATDYAYVPSSSRAHTTKLAEKVSLWKKALTPLTNNDKKGE
ncbi:MAG: DNA-deoxyinosine glycosylase [Candidatus Omnitrophota bacterium]|nr:DNA-deoxyinosine glycosylase [Candidatus Omnitrophota bacterium]